MSSDSPRCDGHQVRPQSKIAPPNATDKWRFCIHCYRRITERGLEPGEDFDPGELPTPDGDP